ncbi:MAG TPA: ribonuclease III, partial [Leucothrix sp.]|nr:ribonuclease III [Leucothrix sp.]
PLYELLGVAGDAHRQVFTAECTIESMQIITRGVAGSRRKAEQQSAQNAYEIVIQKFKKPKK